MRKSFIKIRDVAQKESHAGYGDYAVFGGFSVFVEELLVKENDDDAMLIKSVVRHYSDSNLATRKAIIDLLFHLLSQDDTESAEETEAVFVAERNVTPKEKTLLPANASVDGDEIAVPPKDIPSDLQYLKGVGPKKIKLLQKLGIKTVADLVTYFPRRHEDRREVMLVASLFDGQTALISGYVDQVQVNRIRSQLQIVKARLSDESGFITVVWFNQPWLKNRLVDGTAITVYGKADLQYGKRNFVAAEYEFGVREDGFGILPVYGLTAGLSQKSIRLIVANALELFKGRLEEFLPSSFMARYDLENREKAVFDYHFPPDFDALNKSRYRLVFEEFFLFRLAFRLKGQGEKTKGRGQEEGEAEDFYRLLPFVPTAAQRRVIGEIYVDMAAPLMMNRLVEGDVGSGKTVVAAAAVYRCCRSHHQAALMAPTEILAMQHYRSLTALFQGTGLRIALLTGAVKAAEKREICLALSEGRIDLLVGTHALIENNAVFRDLALVVIDEQHRFGVNQRNALFMKGNDPDLLVMTATPIPRTLAMTVFAGLDISLLDEMPPGRKPPKTMVITRAEEERAFSFMKKHIAAGRQCFMVCPLVEESESLDLEAAKELYERLKNKEMKQISIGLVHGKMKSAEKDAVLEAFRKNEIAVLVATTVIEVGIDVPNATVMMIRDADRFGLAQLHQIRGRIGRGDFAGTCLLETAAGNEQVLKRLRVLEQYSDGFKVAEEDLKLRGPGDFFGVRQHGLPELKLADLFQDHALLVEAAHAVDTLLKEDPHLDDEAWQKTKAHLKRLYDLGK